MAWGNRSCVRRAVRLWREYVGKRQGGFGWEMKQNNVVDQLLLLTCFFSIYPVAAI